MRLACTVAFFLLFSSAFAQSQQLLHDSDQTTSDAITIPLRPTSNPSKFFAPLRNQTSASDDTFCLKIRSYVVARDSKESDATHLVSSSTCVPANKYKVKIVQQPVAPEPSPNH